MQVLLGWLGGLVRRQRPEPWAAHRGYSSSWGLPVPLERFRFISASVCHQKLAVTAAETTFRCGIWPREQLSWVSGVGFPTGDARWGHRQY